MNLRMLEEKLNKNYCKETNNKLVFNLYRGKQREREKEREGGREREREKERERERNKRKKF